MLFLCNKSLCCDRGTVYIIQYTLHRVIFGLCFFVLLTSNGFARLEFVQTKLCLKRDNFRHWNSPSHKFTYWHWGRTEQKEIWQKSDMYIDGPLTPFQKALKNGWVFSLLADTCADMTISFQKYLKFFIIIILYFTLTTIPIYKYQISRALGQLTSL